MTLDKSIEYLDWALSIIDDYFQRYGDIGFAEAIIWKAAKAHCRAAKQQAQIGSTDNGALNDSVTK